MVGDRVNKIRHETKFKRCIEDMNTLSDWMIDYDTRYGKRRKLDDSDFSYLSILTFLGYHYLQEGCGVFPWDDMLDGWGIAEEWKLYGIFPECYDLDEEY